MKAGTLIVNFIFVISTFLTISSCSEDLILEEETATAVSEEKADLLTKSSTGFKFGVNGHPMGAPSYKSVPPAEQMKLLKSMGMNSYRFGVMTMSDGRVTVPYLFDPFVKAAQEAGITLLPMLYTRTLEMSDDQATSYSRGRKLGKNFASRYKHLFSYYQLGNELDIDCVLPGKAGKSQFSYDRKKFNVIAAYLKGMNDGIKSEDPTAKTMIVAGWLRYAYPLMLEDYGVKYDIISYHWYSEMDGAAKSGFNIPDILDKLNDKFDKPIWFTEIGYRHKSSLSASENERRQHAFLTSFTERCRKNPQVKAVFIYELFNEPEKNSNLESNYGIVKWLDPFARWAYKLTAETLAQ